MKDLKVNELKKICIALDISTKGTKKQLKERIEEFQNQQNYFFPDNPIHDDSINNENSNEDSIGLESRIVDNHSENGDIEIDENEYNENGNDERRENENKMEETRLLMKAQDLEYQQCLQEDKVKLYTKNILEITDIQSISLNELYFLLEYNGIDYVMKNKYSDNEIIEYLKKLGLSQNTKFCNTKEINKKINMESEVNNEKREKRDDSDEDKPLTLLEMRDARLKFFQKNLKSFQYDT
tara:strand:+ start:2402 stop:3118 length:717 start_codon:yes stop_codon:yes gene_type:complete